MSSFNSGSTNPNWSFTFSGLAEVQTSKANVIPVEGYYEAILVSNVQNPDREGTVEFTCRIKGGEFDGSEVSKGIKLPSHANNQFVWKGLFQSLGYDEKVINAAQFNPNPADCNGQPVFIYWKPGSKELSVYRELRFCVELVSQEARFEAQKQATVTAAPTAPARPLFPLPSASIPNAGTGLQINVWKCC